MIGCSFIDNHAYGEDFDECYELVLHEAKNFNWLSDSRKVLVLIGDANPHAPSYHLNTKNLSWRHEVNNLVNDHNVSIYAVQCPTSDGRSARLSSVAMPLSNLSCCRFVVILP